MATIRKIIDLNACAEKVWDALADFHNVHTRIAPGFVTACEADGDVRVVTFANGSIARERFIAADPTLRRLVYAIASERLTHHSASAEVVPLNAQQCRFIWTTDLTPDEMAPYVDAQMSLGLTHMKPALERNCASVAP